MTFKYSNFIVVFVFIILVVLIGFFFADVTPAKIIFPTHLRWLSIAGLMLLFLIFLGYQVNRRGSGILIDSRNKISLSRFQMTAWTILVMSAFLTIGLARSREGYLSELTDEMIAICKTEIQETQLETAEGEVAAEAMADEECREQPLKITFPGEIVAALGISSVSLAGSSFVKGSKRGRKRSVRMIENRKDRLNKNWEEAKDRLSDIEVALVRVEAEAQRAGALYEEAYDNWQDAITDEDKEDARRIYEAARADQLSKREEVETLLAEKRKWEVLAQQAEREIIEFNQAAENARGLLHRNESPAEASWADMFREEEITNFQSISLSKVQMFFFTIAIIFTYAASLYTLMQNDPVLKNPLGIDLPAFTASLNVLLGISHASYLFIKNTDDV